MRELVVPLPVSRMEMMVLRRDKRAFSGIGKKVQVYKIE